MKKLVLSPYILADHRVALFMGAALTPSSALLALVKLLSAAAQIDADERYGCFTEEQINHICSDFDGAISPFHAMSDIAGMFWVSRNAISGKDYYTFHYSPAFQLLEVTEDGMLDIARKDEEGEE